MVQLSDLLDRARSHVPALVAVEGPAGIGKTALVNRFLESTEDVLTVRASGDETETGLAFGVLDQLVAGMPKSSLEAAGLATLQSRCSGEPSGSGAIDPLLAGAELVELLGELQRSCPVVLALDDVHWADHPSLLALTFALRRLSRDRVLVVVVLRDTDVVVLPEPFRRLLSTDTTTRLVLAGLTAADIRSLSAVMVGEALSPRAADRLCGHTEGNPLHVRALLAQLPPEALRRADGPLPAPRSFALLVVGRLAACRADTRRLVSAASVLGRRCPLHLAGKLSGLADPLEALDEAVQAGLLVESAASRLIEFPHPLLQAAVYQLLSASDRYALHQLAAEAVDDERTRLRHRLRAATGPDPSLARDLADFAHRRTALGDWSSGAEHLAAAAELATGAEGDQLAAEAIDCQLMAGDAPDVAAKTDQLRSLPGTAWRDYVLARLALAAGRLDEAEPLLQDAWSRCAADSDSSLTTRVAGQLGWLYVARDRGKEAVEWSERALDLAGGPGSSDMSRTVHLAALAMAGRSDQGLASLPDLRDPAVASVVELDALLGRAHMQCCGDDLIGACQDLTGVLASAAGRSVTFQMSAAGMLGMVDYWLGRWDDAAIHSGVAVSLAVDTDQGWLVSICDAIASFVPSARGEWAQAAHHVENAARHLNPGHATAKAHVASARAHLASARNDPTAVVDALQPLMALDPASSAFETGRIVRWPDLLVEALTVEGRHDEAAAALDWFEARAAERPRHSELAAAARARGTLLTARHQFNDAMAAFHTGLNHMNEIDMPFDRALLDLAAGSCLRRAGKRNAAAEHLRAAAATFEHLRAQPYLDRTDRELAACGHRHVQRARVTNALLTAQEFAVAHLAAQGLTNRQIARELVISTKTVEYHLGHVYAKLQISSRVQLTHRLGEREDCRRD
jgi:ATP/maltotriose-dependent transcriptional regulator MalT